MFAPLLLALALVAPAPTAPTKVDVAKIASVSLFEPGYLLVIQHDARGFLVNQSRVSFARGLAEIPDDAVVVEFGGTPQDLEEVWTQADGSTAKVRTSCATLTVEDCIAKHLRMVKLYKAAAPPVPVKRD